MMEDSYDGDDDTAVRVYDYGRRETTQPSPSRLHVVFFGAAPPQTARVHPEGVLHCVTDAITSVQRDPALPAMVHVTKASSIGIRLVDFAAGLRDHKPTVLLLCMHFEATAGANRKLLHFAETDGSGAATVERVVKVLTRHQSQMSQRDAIACIVLLSCDCAPLGKAISKGLGPEVRVVATNRILYQTQAEAWGVGFVDAVCRGANVGDAMGAARARLNRMYGKKTVVGVGGDKVNLGVKDSDPLFTCFLGEEPLPATDHYLLRGRTDGWSVPGWDRLRAVLSKPFPPSVPTALSRRATSGHRGLDLMYVPMLVRTGAKGGHDSATEDSATIQRRVLDDLWVLAQQRTHVVIEGAAGMGKSTIAHMLGSQQLVPGWPDRLQAVAVINLSTLRHSLCRSRNDPAPTLEQVVRKAFRVQSKDVEEPCQWLREYASQVVWVLDCYDEVERREFDNSSNFDLWLKQVLSPQPQWDSEWQRLFCNVIVLTRPGRSHPVFPSGLHLSLEAWTEVSIRDYVGRFEEGLAATRIPTDGLSAPAATARRRTIMVQKCAAGRQGAAHRPTDFQRSVMAILLGLPAKFAGIPFVCEITCHLVAERQFPVGKRVNVPTLYEAMVNLMWQHESDHNRRDTQEVRRVLSAFALHAYRNGGLLPATADDVPVDPDLKQLMTDIAVARSADSPIVWTWKDVRLETFGDVKKCWALDRNGFVHKSIMEYLVASAIATQPLDAFRASMNDMVHLNVALEGMLLVFLAGLLRRSQYNVMVSTDLNMKARELAVRVTTKMVEKYEKVKDKFDLGKLQTSFGERNTLGALCCASLVMEVLAELNSANCNQILWGKVVGGKLAFLFGRAYGKLLVVLLEPAARHGNLEAVKSMLGCSVLRGFVTQALHEAVTARQGEVVAWCLKPSGGGLKVSTALDLCTVTAVGNHRLLAQLLTDRAMSRHFTREQKKEALLVAVRLGHLECMVTLVEKGNVSKEDALKAAVELSQMEAVHVCIEQLGASLQGDVGELLLLAKGNDAWGLFAHASAYVLEQVEMQATVNALPIPFLVGILRSGVTRLQVAALRSLIHFCVEDTSNCGQVTCAGWAEAFPMCAESSSDEVRFEANRLWGLCDSDGLAAELRRSRALLAKESRLLVLGCGGDHCPYGGAFMDAAVQSDTRGRATTTVYLHGSPVQVELAHDGGVVNGFGLPQAVGALLLMDTANQASCERAMMHHYECMQVKGDPDFPVVLCGVKNDKIGSLVHGEFAAEALRVPYVTVRGFGQQRDAKMVMPEDVRAALTTLMGIVMEAHALRESTR